MIIEDNGIFEKMKRLLYTAVICDTLDELGYRNQAMNESLRPLDLNLKMIGRAKTMLTTDIYHIVEDCYAKEIEALDSIRPGEVAVVATNGSTRNGPWGELLSTAAKMRGGTGAVIDGLIRDTGKIVELGFPVYSTGIKPVDSKGRGLLISFGEPIEAGGVHVRNGDVVFGDRDGIVIIPQEVLGATVTRALAKVEGENNTRRELLEGKLLREVYDKYGVL